MNYQRPDHAERRNDERSRHGVDYGASDVCASAALAKYFYLYRHFVTLSQERPRHQQDAPGNHKRDCGGNQKIKIVACPVHFNDT